MANEQHPQNESKNPMKGGGGNMDRNPQGHDSSSQAGQKGGQKPNQGQKASDKRTTGSGEDTDTTGGTGHGGTPNAGSEPDRARNPGQKSHQ
ncbi:MAG TPA: hypothetical protein VGG49_08125 [Steroidobacteraceae bacterium]|jgi:hypothetical protein